MDSSFSGDVTRLLTELQRGNRGVVAELVPMLYRELHDAAERALQGERRDHTLQPTALINEAYLRLAGQKDVQWQSRSHFVGVAATMMRRILVDHARARQSLKRGGEFSRIALDDALAAEQGRDEYGLEALDACLAKLSALDERQARLVELRFFGGLGVEETAAVLEVSPATVKREWNSARAFLRREMAAAGEGRTETEGA